MVGKSHTWLKWPEIYGFPWGRGNPSKWSYNPYKWAYKWVIGYITLRGYNPIYNDRFWGPPCGHVERRFAQNQAPRISLLGIAPELTFSSVGLIKG